MDVQKAYNLWAQQYDTNDNKTRDLEGRAFRKTLSGYNFKHCLEIGCGTGKNTLWLKEMAEKIIAVDLSEEMLNKAKLKVRSDKVEFIQADILREWSFLNGEKFDLITFSLVLEHIENIDPIFQKMTSVIEPGGYVYIGELHPFKQYAGSKARFETEKGLMVVDCYNHHISDFARTALRNGFTIENLNEYFDESNRTGLPRIIVLLLRKKD